MQTFRNVAIIALLALAITVVPGGDAAAATIGAALSMAFAAAIAWALFRLYDSQQMTLMTLTDPQRTVMFGAIGAIALLIAGYEQFSDWSGGVAVWIFLMFMSGLAIFVVWRRANIYS